MNNEIYWVWLTNLAGIFPNKINALLEHFESPEEIYNAGAEDFAGIAGISRCDVLVLNSKDLTRAGQIIESCEKTGTVILTYDDKNYPDSLRKIPNPPYVLYLRGEVMPWDRLLCIGIVGTRHCGSYGREAAHHLACELALKGVTIVSGMAAGIDTVAANAALESGGKTVAVLGCGPDVAYPAENAGLMQRIIENGAIVTEYPPGTRPAGYRFPVRNRIISGLSKGILVAEAPPKSGALITARYAIETGKDLFVVPGRIFDYGFIGSNELLKSAGKATICANDILEEYPDDAKKLSPPENGKAAKPVKAVSIDDERYSALGETERKIIELLITGNMHINEIKAETGADMDKLNSALPLLEMTGLIRKLPGDNYKLEC